MPGWPDAVHCPPVLLPTGSSPFLVRLVPAATQLTNLCCGNVAATLSFGSYNVGICCGKNVNLWTPKNVLQASCTTLQSTFN